MIVGVNQSLPTLLNHHQILHDVVIEIWHGVAELDFFGISEVKLILIWQNVMEMGFFRVDKIAILVVVVNQSLPILNPYQILHDVAMQHLLFEHETILIWQNLMEMDFVGVKYDVMQDLVHLIHPQSFSTRRHQFVDQVM